MPRPSPTHWTQPAKPGDPCPCGSEAAFADCCFRRDEMPLLKVSEIRPPPPATNHAHPKCYMRPTNDCSTKISAEHYVSAAILAEFGNLRTSGLPFFGPGETHVGINALTSNILCTRHNSALSPLDAEGRRMLVAIRAVINHIWKKSLSTKTLFRIVSGEAFELWGLKTLMGLLAANVARTDGASTADNFTIPEALIVETLTTGRLPPGYGLYVGHESDMLHDTVGFAPLTHMESQRVSSLRCTFLGIIMDFILDSGVASGIVAENDPYFRPAVMDFDGAKRTARLILTRGDQRRDGHRISFEMRTVPTTANEAAELKDRWARKDFQRRL